MCVRCVYKHVCIHVCVVLGMCAYMCVVLDVCIHVCWVCVYTCVCYMCVLC